MNPEFAADVAQLGGLDQARMRQPYRMQCRFDVLHPMIKETVNARKTRRKIKCLPGEGLEKVRVVRHPVENFRCSQ